MSQVIEDHRRRKQARDLFLTQTPVSDFMASGERSPDLVKAIIESFCDHRAPGGAILDVFDSKNHGTHLNIDALATLGVTLESAATVPDVIIHDSERNRLLLVEAATSGGPTDERRRKELQDLFADCTAELVFITAIESRQSMQKFASEITWGSEVWIADDADHLIHFSGEAFLVPHKP
jgi:hypothetical protein